MSLLYRKGNLIDLAEAGEFDAIVHGCNCQNVMGSGIAKELRTRYPKTYEVDTLATKTWKIPVAKLGSFSTYGTVGKQSPFIIINAYTQLHYLPRGIDHFEYESFYIILRKLAEMPNCRFGFPHIGMGLAGGDSARIIPMLKDFATRIEPLGSTATLVEYQPSEG